MIFKKILNYCHIAQNIQDQIEKDCNKPKNAIFYILDILLCRVIFKIGMEEYSFLKVYNIPIKKRRCIITKHERNRFVDTYNDRCFMDKIERKDGFLKNYEKYTGRKFLILKQSNFKEFEEFLKTHKIVIAKHAMTMQGYGIKTYRLSANHDNIEDFFMDIKNSKFDIVEEFVTQHPDFARINEYGLPVIRVLTFLNEDNHVDILITTITVGNNDDEIINFHRGGIYLNIDSESGIITSNGIDKEGKKYECHPVLNTSFKNFQIPMWKKTLDLVKEASLVTPEVRYVGWDIGITEHDPIIIEANAKIPGITTFQHPELNDLNLMEKRFAKMRSGLTN